MLKPEAVRKVKELLTLGTCSQRAIARLTGVSRVVIHRIATGKRKDRPERVKEPWEDDWTGRPYERCPTCGSKVRLPCLACIIRSLPINCNNDVPSNTLILGLELEDKHRFRYEQVRAWRESQNDPDFTEVPEDWPFRKRWKTVSNQPKSRGWSAAQSPDPTPEQ